MTCEAQPIRGLSVAALALLGLVLSGGAQTRGSRVYSNEEVGYTLSYPASWFVAPPAYRNAVAFQNYDESHAVLQKDEARILVSYEQPATLEQARRRVKILMDASSKRAGFHAEKVRAGETDLYQWTALEPPAVPAVGRAGSGGRMRIRVSSALIGIPLVRAEGTAGEDASSNVVTQMKDITRSIRLLRHKGGER